MEQRPSFSVAAVVLRDTDGLVLHVRKFGTAAFMLPGGKLEPGETSDRTAVREIAEEVGLHLDPDALTFVGAFVTDTANEPGYALRSDVYTYGPAVEGAVAASEIAELRWVDPRTPTPDLAPLTVALLAGLLGGQV